MVRIRNDRGFGIIGVSLACVCGTNCFGYSVYRSPSSQGKGCQHAGKHEQATSHAGLTLNTNTTDEAHSATGGHFRAKYVRHLLDRA